MYLIAYRYPITYSFKTFIAKLLPQKKSSWKN